MRRLRPGVVALVTVVLAVGVAVAIGPGWRGLAVYAFFVGLAALFAFGMGVASGVVTGASRGRFHREDRQ